MTRSRRLYALIVAAVVLAIPMSAEDRYMTPPPELAQLVDAPLTPAVTASPDGTVLVLLDRPSLAPISELAEEELRIAGLRINPRTNGPSRSRTTPASGPSSPPTGLSACAPATRSEAVVPQSRWPA